MDMEPTEKNLKELFNELKDQDARRVPSFDAVLAASDAGAANPGTHFRLRFAWGMGAAFLVAALLTLMVLTFRVRSREAEVQQWAMLSDWAASTDALLDASSVLPDSANSPTDFFINPDSDSLDTTTQNL